jgi:hypothetical protein
MLVGGQGESRDGRKQLRDSANRSGLDMPTVKDEIDRLLELSEAEPLANVLTDAKAKAKARANARAQANARAKDNARARARSTVDSLANLVGSTVSGEWRDEVARQSVMINDLRAKVDAL